MTKLYCFALFTIAALVACPLMAQPSGTTPPSVITTPPRTMSSLPEPETPGQDSTFSGSVAPNAANAQVVINVPPNGPPTCTASSSNNTQTASCPAGTLTSSGSATFTQTDTRSTTCPGGAYGSPSTSTTPWAPVSNATTCPQPTANNNPAICMSHGGMPYTDTPIQIGSGTFAQNGVTNFVQHSTGLGFATGSYSVSITFDGSTQTANLSCTAPGNDFCSSTQNFNVGAGTFQVTLSAQSCLPGDCVAGSGIRSATTLFQQINCE
jgi:hypothetical protein